MGVNFEANHYFHKVCEIEQFNTEDKIFRQAHAGLQFEYVDVSYDNFNQKYSVVGCVGRKVTAIFNAAWSGVIKTVYHLAKAVFFGAMLSLTDDGKYLQTHVYYVVRDLQESLGWIITIFHDSYGQYHVQQSQFHKSCYECFLVDDSLPVRSSALTSVPSSTLAPTANSLQTTSGIYKSTNSSNYGREICLTLTPISHGINKNTSTRSKQPLETKSVERNLDKEFEDLKKELHTFKTSETDVRCIELANAYFVEGQWEKSLEVMDQVNYDTKTVVIFRKKVAEALFERGELRNALATSRQNIFEIDYIQSFALKVTEAYFKIKDLDNAASTVVLAGHEEKAETCRVKIAYAFLAKNELDSSLSTILEVLYQDESRDSCVVKIAEAYLEQGNQHKAVYVINTFGISSEVREAFMLKIDPEKNHLTKY